MACVFSCRVLWACVPTLLTLLLASCSGTPPGVRLVRPAPDATVATAWEVELEVTGEAEAAGVDIYADASATEPLRRYDCTRSCTVSFAGTANSYEVRGWATIDGKPYETPRQRVTVDHTPLVALFARVRAFNTLEVRFTKSITLPTSPQEVQVTRRLPTSGKEAEDLTDSPAVTASLDSTGRVLTLQGEFGAPAVLTLDLNLKDSKGAWTLSKKLEVTQNYFSDVGQVEQEVIKTHALMFDGQGRVIASWGGFPRGLNIARREADGTWTDLITGDANEPCLRTVITSEFITQAADGTIYALCGENGQLLRRDSPGWTALGVPLFTRSPLTLMLSVDGQGRPVAMATFQGATPDGSGYDDRVTAHRFENGAWRTLSDRLNAPDKHLSTASSIAVAPDGVPLAIWVEGNVARGSQSRAVRLTDTGPEALPWAEDLALSTVTASDGTGGLWMAATQVSTSTPVVLRLTSSTATPEVLSRGTALPDIPLFFRDEHGHLAMFGRRIQQVGSDVTDPGDPNSGSTPILSIMISLQHLEGGTWKKLPELNAEILERNTVGQRVAVKVARAPDGTLHALLEKSYVDFSTPLPTARSELVLVRQTR